MSDRPAMSGLPSQPAPFPSRRAHYTLARSRSLCGRGLLLLADQQLGHSHQVVGRGHQVACQAGPARPPIPTTAGPARRPFGSAQDRLDPSEDLFHTLARSLASEHTRHAE